MTKRILIIATLDTKGKETFYLREKMEALGLRTLLMDLSMRGGSDTTANITPERVAKAGGSNIQAIRESRERSSITNIVISGASRLAKHRITSYNVCYTKLLRRNFNH